MKKFFIMLMIVSALHGRASLHDDKFMHIFAGSAIYIGCLIVTDIAYDDPEMEWCLFAPLVAGVGKELYDRHDYGRFDLEDLGATMAIPMTSVVIYKW